MEDYAIDDSVIEAAKDPIISDLADRILEAEAELKRFFEPGKAMPSVGGPPLLHDMAIAWLCSSVPNGFVKYFIHRFYNILTLRVVFFACATASTYITCRR
jgi:hypothetical protein